MPDFYLWADLTDSRCSYDLIIDNGKDLDLVQAVGLFLQEGRFPLRGKAVFIGIGEQKVRLRMDLIENNKNSITVCCFSVSEKGGFSVL